MLPIPRLTIRRLMLVVAVVAIATGGWISWRRHLFHRERATTARQIASGLRRNMKSMPPAALAQGLSLNFEDGKPSVPAEPEACERFLAHLERVIRRHDYAARYPWLPMPPGPE